MAVSVVLGFVVAAYGLASSYVTVSKQAARCRVPLSGAGGYRRGVVTVVVLDLVLAWIGMPVGWLRQWVRVLSVGTIAANAVGGWPDPVAVGLHGAAPLMLLAMVEAGRTVLLRRIRQGRGTLREAVPLARWLLAPWRTWLLWRRMVLWRVASYQRAVEVELELRRAVSVLRMHTRCQHGFATADGHRRAMRYSRQSRSRTAARSEGRPRVRSCRTITAARSSALKPAIGRAAHSLSSCCTRSRTTSLRRSFAPSSVVNRNCETAAYPPSRDNITDIMCPLGDRCAQLSAMGYAAGPRFLAST